jgi:hypothetical protein
VTTKAASAVGVVSRIAVLRMSFGAYVLILILSQTLLAAAGNRVGVYLLLALSAIPAIVAGGIRARVVAGLLFILAIGLTVRDYRAGEVLRDRVRAVRQAADRDVEAREAGAATSPKTERP